MEIKDIIKACEYLNDAFGRITRSEASIYTQRSDTKRLIYSFYGKKCLCCGRKDNIALDHVVPVDKGGQNILINIQPLCLKCNSTKGTKIIDHRKKVESLY